MDQRRPEVQRDVSFAPHGMGQGRTRHDYGGRGVGRSDGSGDIPWAVKMEIKNDLFGEKRVAVEAFPTQDRLVDVCDCYHLWVFEKDSSFRSVSTRAIRKR